MILPAELEILKNYGLHNAVSLEDYFIDFIIKNPLNYPFTSWFMRNIRTTGRSLNMVLNRTNVAERFCDSQISQRSKLSKLMLLEKDTGFNMVMLPPLSDSISFQIIQSDPVLIISIRNSNYNAHEILIDQYLNDIIVYRSKNLIKILTSFTKKKFNDLEDFKNQCDCEIWYLGISKETELTDVEKSCILANTISQSSVYDGLVKDSNSTEFCKRSIYHEHNNDNIFKDFYRNESRYNSFQCETVTKFSSLHYDGIDKMPIGDLTMT